MSNAGADARRIGKLCSRLGPLKSRYHRGWHLPLTFFAVKMQSLQKHVLTYGDGFYGSKRVRSAIAQFLNGYFDPNQAVRKNMLWRLLV